MPTGAEQVLGEGAPCRLYEGETEALGGRGFCGQSGAKTQMSESN